MSVVEDIRQLEQEFMQAVADRDLATLERLVGPEFTLTTGRPGSAVRGRDEWMRISATRYVIEDFGFDEMDVVDLGSAAVGPVGVGGDQPDAVDPVLGSDQQV